MTADFWIRLMLAALIIVGVWTLFQPKQLLQEFGDWATWFLGQHAVKPLFACVKCMSSVWGTSVWFFAGGDVVWWVPFCLALCGFMTLLSKNLLD